MSNTTGKKETFKDLVERLGGKLAPPDHPLFKTGWIIGATVPYGRKPKPFPSEEQSAPQEKQDAKSGAKRSRGSNH